MNRTTVGIIATLAALLMAAGSVTPAAALWCYECVDHGVTCGSLGCRPLVSCSITYEACTTCWDDCAETPDGYCIIGQQCEWAANPVARDFLIVSRSAAAESCGP